MSELLIDKLTNQVELNKTAEEIQLEKTAQAVNVLDQAQTLTLVADQFDKIAEETKEELFSAIAGDLRGIGSRMGSTLVKTASENSDALEESFDIAADLNKIASAVAEIADQIKDEQFNELIAPVIAISNEMTTDANEVIETIEKEAAEKKKMKS